MESAVAMKVSRKEAREEKSDPRMWDSSALDGGVGLEVRVVNMKWLFHAMEA